MKVKTMSNTNENEVVYHNDENENDHGLIAQETAQEGVAYYADTRFDKRCFNAKNEFVNLQLTYDLNKEADKTLLSDMIEVMADSGYNVIVAPSIVGEKLMQQEAKGMAVLEIVTTNTNSLDENGAVILGENGKPLQTAVIAGVLVNNFDFDAMKTAAAADVLNSFLAIAVHAHVRKTMKAQTKIIWVENSDTGEKMPRLQIGASLPTMPAGIFAAKTRVKSDIRDGLGVFFARFLSQRDATSAAIWKSIKALNFLKSLRSSSFAAHSSHAMLEHGGKFKELLVAVSNAIKNPVVKTKLLPQMLLTLPAEKQQEEEFSPESIEIFFSSNWADEIIASRDLVAFKLAEVKMTEEEKAMDELLNSFGR